MAARASGGKPAGKCLGPWQPLAARSPRLPLLRCRALFCQNLLLPLGAPAVAAGFAVAAHDAVAGDDEGGAVVGAGIGHRAYGFGLSDRLGDLAVAGGLAIGDLVERAPDFPLERGRLEIERQRQIRPLAGDVLEDGGDPGLEVLASAPDLGCGILRVERAFEPRIIVAEAYRRET